jgi:hypothetical protein
VEDCTIGYDEDGDGVSEGTITANTHSIPAGSDVAAFCDLGFNLENSLVLA